jgi:hypothetical protein
MKKAKKAAKRQTLKKTGVAYLFEDKYEGTEVISLNPPEFQTTVTSVNGKVRSTETSFSSLGDTTSLCRIGVKALIGRALKPGEAFKLNFTIEPLGESA